MKVIRQREKLYDCEDELGFGGWFPGVEYYQMYIDRITRTKWWKEHSSIRYVKAVYPAQGMSGSIIIDDTHGEIHAGLARLCEYGVIHELTHFLDDVPVTDGNRPIDHERDHGPIFAGALLAMYKRFIGKKTSDDLRKLFDAKGVIYDDFE